MAPEIFAQEAPVLDCHCKVCKLDPPEVVAVSRELPPIQISANCAAILAVGSALTKTEIEFDAGSEHDGCVSATCTLYQLVPGVAVGALYVNAVSPGMLFQVELLVLDCH